MSSKQSITAKILFAFLYLKQGMTGIDL